MNGSEQDGVLPPHLASKITRNEVTGCWEWTGARDSRGYGNIRVGRSVRKAHRVVFETFRGPVPPGFECDHRCRVPWCVNPDHLEAVPHLENVRRGAARWVPAARQRAKRRCPRGHSYNKGNTYVHPRTGGRACRICDRERKRVALSHRSARRVHLVGTRLDERGEAISGLSQVPLTYDVVAIEHGSCLVPADLHRHTLGNPSPDHIAHGSTP